VGPLTTTFSCTAEVQPLNWTVRDASRAPTVQRKQEHPKASSAATETTMPKRTSKTGSELFIVDEPDNVAQDLDDLRRELLADPYFRKVPSMQSFAQHLDA
jgi:hypothetical protein